jgi:hypothetical protein
MIFGEASQRFALLAGGWLRFYLEAEKPEARKILEKPQRTHLSSARFVGTLLTLKTHL